jgi:hypothetical protein
MMIGLAIAHGIAVATLQRPPVNASAETQGRVRAFLEQRR